MDKLLFLAGLLLFPSKFSQLLRSKKQSIMRSVYSQFIALLLISNIVSGQATSKESYFGIRAGYLRASTNLTSSNTSYGLGGVAPRNSFYGGVFYHQNISRWLAYRTELNYQQKGIENQDYDGNVLFQQKFHYIGLTPLIGFTPISGLGFFVGPEANVHFGRSMWSNNAASIEIGVSGRVSYRYKSIGVEVGYFKGLNEYTSVDFGDNRFGFKNRTWQAGLLFVPKKFIKGNKVN